MSRKSGPVDAGNETIVALATPEGVGGLAVVRLSGERAVECAGRIFRCAAFAGEVVSHRAYHGFVIDPAEGKTGEAVDEVVVLPMLAPRSYTGEDTVEISCHGGVQPARLVIEACVAAGARPARAGEFTRRAFINGRISLDQAEAVADLIHAEDRLAAKGAVAQLDGGLRREIVAIEEPLIKLLADLEGGLEFAAEEEAGLDVPREKLIAICDDALARVVRLIDLGPEGRRIREGVGVVLLGDPNAGKSSLFNALLGRPRALVDPEAGTTRDIVDATMIHRGVRFELHDTAGLRSGAGRVENMGIELAREAAGSADIVLLLKDLSVDVKDINADGEAGFAFTADGAERIRVGTKIDLAGDIGTGRPVPKSMVVTSAVTGLGIDELRDRIWSVARADRMEEAASLGIVLNRRHRHRLAVVRDELEQLREIAAAGAEDEILATMLAAALTGFGEISGRVFSENLLGEIFSRFCVGK